MTQIVVEQELTSQLEKLNAPAELVDRSGRALGRFVPFSPFLPSDNCPYSDEEIALARAERGGRPLAEIWKSLGAK